MTLIQCELVHPTVKSCCFLFLFEKISVLEVEIGKNGPGILGIKK
jgi:hypothetical protein